MVTQVLDQITKLFGKSFLISAFIPSLLFAAGVYILTRGVRAFQDFMLGLVSQEWQAVLFQLLLLLTGIYLLAYILFGIRSWINLFFQGEWAWPLTRVKERFIRQQVQAMHQARRLRDKKLYAMNPFYWAEKGFSPGPGTNKLSSSEIRYLVDIIRQKHRQLVEQDERGEPISEKEYGGLIRLAWELSSQGPGSEDNENSAMIARLLEELANAQDSRPAMHEAARSSMQLALREWQDAYNSFQDIYPEDERWLRPTRLGNVFGALEEYTYKRYGISFGDLWPRLAPLINDSTQKLIDDASTYYEFMLMMGVLALLLSVIALLTGLRDLTRWIVVLLLLAACAMFYKVSIYAARSFTKQVQAAIDLNRLKLLETLKIKMPANPAAEKEIWVDLRRFFAQGAMPSTRIQFDFEKKEESKKESGK